MQTWISLIRGVNVGGHKKINKDQLVAIHAAVGCLQAQTYIQSGNVLFQHPQTQAEPLAGALVAELERHLGFAADVTVVSPVELATALDQNPFTAEAALEPATCLLGFLPQPVDPAQVAGMKPVDSGPDRFALGGRVVYLHCPQGVARTKLTNAYFEKQLRTRITFRNAQVVAKLLELSQGLGAGKA